MKIVTTECILTLGSNSANREEMMISACRWLVENFGTPLADSGVYETKALNGRSPDYLNMVVKITTEMTAERVIALGKEFEASCGRTPDSKKQGIVEMDVDLVRYGNVVLRPEEFSRQYFLTGYNNL